MNRHATNVIAGLTALLALLNTSACESRKDEPNPSLPTPVAAAPADSTPAAAATSVEPPTRSEPATASAMSAEPAAATAPSSAEPINLALAEHGGRIVYFSSQYDAGSWAVNNLIDGGTNKTWSANSGQPQSLVLAFQDERPARLVDIVINPYTRESKHNWVKEVEIHASDDSPIFGYRPVGTMTLNNEAGDQVFSFDSPVTARFVKFNFISNYGGSYMQAGEIMIMGELLAPSTSATSPLVNLAAAENGGQLAKFSSEYDAEGWAAANLIDGGSNKAWSSNSANPQEIIIQLAGDGTRRVRAVAISPYSRESVKNWVKDVEIYTSPQYSYKGFALAGQMELKPSADYQALMLATPIEAKYVKLSFKSNRGGSYMQASEVAVLGQ